MRLRNILESWSQKKTIKGMTSFISYKQNMIKVSGLYRRIFSRFFPKYEICYEFSRFYESHAKSEFTRGDKYLATNLVLKYFLPVVLSFF